MMLMDSPTSQSLISLIDLANKYHDLSMQRLLTAISSRGLVKTPIGLLLQKFNNRDGRVCIQSSGGFVQKQHLRLNDQLHTNVSSLPLSS